VPSYSDISQSLQLTLTLNLTPIAVCLLNTIPEGLHLYSKVAPAGCRFWQEGMQSSFATSSKDHSLCVIGTYTHNLEPSSARVEADLIDALKIFAELDYVRSQDLPLIPVLKDRPKYVAYAPLAEAPAQPDVVLLFVKPNQLLILSEAAQQVEAQIPLAMGRPACAIIPQVKNTGRAALSLGCCGARAYLDILTDDSAIFAMPGDKLETYAQRIEALAAANSVLSKFHRIRRAEIEAGRTPTIKESLASLNAAT
jgi:uncharacterized protein (DUF169 family)